MKAHVTLLAVTADLDALFRPASIAVVGASAAPGKAGNAMVRSLLGFPGALHLVNPRAGEIEGRAAVASIAAIGEPVDLAVLVVAAEAVVGVLEECGQAGVRAAVVCSGGFAEADLEERQEQIVAVARRYGMRVLGPNTSGFMNPEDRVYANFVPDVTTLEPGPAAIVASSGGVNLAACFAGAADGLGIRLGVGLGNAADVGFADVLRYLAADEATRVVGLQVEGVDDGRALVDAVGELAATKPVVVLKVGRSDIGGFARSHTGRVLGDFAVARAALRHAGAVVVDDLGELVDALRVLAARRIPPRPDPGVGLVTGQAGPGLLMADSLRARGVAIPELDDATVRGIHGLLPRGTWVRNPVDTGRPSDTFGEVLAQVAGDPGVDALLVYALEEGDALDPEAALRAPGEVPVVFGSGGPVAALDRRQRALAGFGVPLYRSPEGAARAVRALVEDSRAQHRRAAADRPRPAVELPAAVVELVAGGQLDEHRAKAVLEGLGVPTPPRRVCADRDAAHAAREELGAPVVVKVLDPGVAHKRALGGVHLGVTTAAALDAALDAIDAIPDRTTAGYLVEAQAGPGAELLVGGFRDPAFGPVVALGRGGAGVEAHGAPALRLAPLSAQDVDELLGEVEGAGPALGAILLAVSDLLVGAPQVEEVDVNPVRLTATGPCALDALVVLADA